MIDGTEGCALIFRGELVAGSDAETIKERLISGFRLNASEADSLLSSNGTIIKKGLSTDEARRYRHHLRQLGLICHIATRHPHASRSPSPPEEPQSSIKATPELIESAFQGEFEDVPLKRKYLLGIAATTVAMLLLPLIYLAIIALLGYGILWHLNSNLPTFNTLGDGVITTTLYIAPVIVGSLLALFLVKPIFAAPERISRPIALDPVRHRRFFHFVGQLCDKIGAPRPSEIHIDSYVNASARLKHGPLSNQLILTVGMPLISHLNTRELAGVLAHELGHFAQRYAMKQGYIINNINHWFYRVVYERDQWDALLDQWLKENGRSYVIVIGHSARLCIWLTRKLLHLLMLLGILVSRFMSRQMEFDADLYAARIAGSQQFRHTTLAIRVLARAFANANHRNMAARKEGMVSDDLPQLATNFAATLPITLRNKLNHEMKSSVSRHWDTHPSDGERITHVEEESHPGIFTLEIPARLLLHNHEQLSKLATLHYYQSEGIPLNEIRLVAPEKIIESASRRSEGQSMLNHYFNGQFQANCILPLYHSPEQIETDLAELEALIDGLRQSAPEAKALAQQHETRESRLAWLRVAYAFAEACIPLDHRAFNLPSTERSALEMALSKALSEFNACDLRIRHHHKLMGQRLSLGLALAFHRGDGQTQQQITLQWRALQGLGKIRETLLGLNSYGFVLSELNAYASDETTKANQTARSYARLCHREIEHIRSVMRNYRDPFALNEETTIEQLIAHRIGEQAHNARNEIEECLAAKHAIIDLLLHMNERLTGALAVHANDAERSAGIKPIRLTTTNSITG